MSTETTTQRITAVDALRGFAVAAIMLIHFCEHFIYGVYPEAPTPYLGELNETLWESMLWLLGGKSYSIFALLFGFTFILQQRHQELRGADFGGRFAWRMVLLMGFASLNAIFFPGGDVLMLFALMGLVMIPLRRCSQRTLLLCATLFLIQPIELLEWCGVELIPTMLNESYYPLLSEVVSSGNLLQMAITNLTTGQLASLLWAVDAGRLLQAPGLFLIGMWLARGEYFTRGAEFWIKVLLCGALCSFVLFTLKAGSEGAAQIVLTMWYNLAFTAVLVALFLVLYQHPLFQRATTPLTYYGRMSLSNYISQSIIGSLIFFPYALGLADTLGVALSLLCGIGVMLLQMRTCRWWLSHHRQGLLESLWHKGTWIGRTNNTSHTS